jgi:hypothetical protein
LTDPEKRLIDLMLQGEFEGRDQLREQLSHARVVAHGPTDTRTIVFAAPIDSQERADITERVPVDASMADLDGTDIEVLLHVVDGCAHELEAYRVDGDPIEREELDGPVGLVRRYPQSSD